MDRDHQSIDIILDGNLRIRRLALLKFIGEEWNMDLKPRISNGPTRAIICNCPFHRENTPSFRMWISGKFKCMGCGKTGRWTDLLLSSVVYDNPEEFLQHCQKFIREKNQNVEQTSFDFTKP